MRPDYISTSRLRKFIKDALREDIGDGDHTTLSSIPEKAESKASIVLKGDGIIAGIEVMKEVWKTVDEDLTLEIPVEDGQQVHQGDIVCTIEGKAQSILTGERLVLNILQRMSGIATKTRKIVDMLKGTNSRVLDTRKTTPNFRMLEKWAVAIGGGVNHRFGLYDQILLKDNHIDMAGGVENALRAAKAYLKDRDLQLKIEIETRTIEEVRQVLYEGGADIIMLDNMIPSQMREAVSIIGKKCLVEASGGITETTILEVAETGVDFISIGALTHSYKSLDMSLKAVK